MIDYLAMAYKDSDHAFMITVVTIRHIGILHIACKMFTIYCYIAIQMWILLNQ